MAEDMGKVDDPGPGHNGGPSISDDEVMSEMMRIHKEIMPLEARRRKLNTDISNKRARLRELGITGTDFNYWRNRFLLEDDDAKARAQRNIRLCAAAFGMVQPSLFPDDDVQRAAYAKEDADDPAAQQGPYGEGVRASRAGKSGSGDNPYTEGTAEYDAFYQGWLADQNRAVKDLTPDADKSKIAEERKTSAKDAATPTKANGSKKPAKKAAKKSTAKKAAAKANGDAATADT